MKQTYTQCKHEDVLTKVVEKQANIYLFELVKVL